MHKNNVRLASPRLPRFDSLTGRRRRGWAALAGGIAVALFLGSGIAVAAVSSAEAHDATPKATCSAITVDATNYNTSKGMNSIAATIDGVPQTTVSFAESAHAVFPIADSTVSHSYTVQMTAADNAQFSYSWSGTTDPCAAPLITASATACTIGGSATALDVSVEKLVAGRQYSVEVLKSGASVGTFPITPTQTIWKSAGATLPAWWSTLTAGATYTVTVVDSTDPSLKASADAVSLACPVSPDLSVALTECAAPASDGQVVVSANLVVGRDYEIEVFKNGSAYDTVSGPATAAVFTRTYPGTASSTWYISVTDVAAKVTDQTTPQTLLPCPGVPVKPVLSLTQCTDTNGVAGGTLSINAGGLVPGRTYAITVSDGTNIVYTAPATGLAPALSSTWSTSPALALQPGTYTVTVTDVSDPAVTTLIASETATLAICPTQQDVAVTATECAVPGGTGTIDASVTDYALGRTYTITLTKNGVAVGTPQDFTPTDAAKPAVPFTFTGLTAGDSYRVLVVDKALPKVVAAGDLTLTLCPGNPETIVTQGTCSIVTGTSAVKVDLAKLVTGQTYTVGISATGVATQQVVATAATASVTFTGVPNSKPYTITVENAAKTLTGTGTITPKGCDLPTFSFNPPTLAYTGSSTALPVTLAVLFLQLGLVLLGVSIARRRRSSAAA